jgi:hypothetical protein
MIKIEPEGIYERSELLGAFPGMDRNTLTRCMLAWGGSRPYPGSRKVFVIGRAILTALGSPQTDELPPPADSGTTDSSPRPRARQSAFLQRRTMWSGDAAGH